MRFCRLERQNRKISSEVKSEWDYVVPATGTVNLPSRSTDWQNNVHDKSKFTNIKTIHYVDKNWCRCMFRLPQKKTINLRPLLTNLHIMFFCQLSCLFTCTVHAMSVTFSIRETFIYILCKGWVVYFICPAQPADIHSRRIVHVPFSREIRSYAWLSQSHVQRSLFMKWTE